MLHMVEMILGAYDDTTTSPDDILDTIHAHIHAKRCVTIDRVEFEECRQEAGQVRTQRLSGYY